MLRKRETEEELTRKRKKTKQKEAEAKVDQPPSIRIRRIRMAIRVPCNNVNVAAVTTFIPEAAELKKKKITVQARSLMTVRLQH